MRLRMILFIGGDWLGLIPTLFADLDLGCQDYGAKDGILQAKIFLDGDEFHARCRRKPANALPCSRSVRSATGGIPIHSSFNGRPGTGSPFHGGIVGLAGVTKEFVRFAAACAAVA